MPDIVLNPLDRRSIERAAKVVRKYKEWLKECTAELVKELAREGVNIAKVNFSTALYSGTNDVVVTEEEDGMYHATIRATGSDVLFIEFGTGVTTADDHPEKPAGIKARGTYGKHRGSHHTWGYYGDPGNNSFSSVEKSKGTLNLTHGDPANACMYNTKRALEMMIDEKVKQIFVWRG